MKSRNNNQIFPFKNLQSSQSFQMTVYDSLKAGFILGSPANMKQAAHHIMACSLWQVQTRFMKFPQNELQDHTYLANILNLWDQMKTT